MRQLISVLLQTTMKNDDKAPPLLQLLNMKTVYLFSFFMLVLTMAPTFISGEYKLAVERELKDAEVWEITKSGQGGRKEREK